MKKKLNEIFDEATPNELEAFRDNLTAPKLSEEELSSIKSKVYSKIEIKQAKKRSGALWMRAGIIAACVALVTVCAAVGALLLSREDNTLPEPDGVENTGDGMSPATDTPPEKTEGTSNGYQQPSTEPPKASTVVSGTSISGKQEIIFGDPSSDNGGYDAEVIAPCFDMQTVIEAEVVEVLPDTYRYKDTSFNVVKLRVLDSLRGEGLPVEIFLRYPYYDTGIFEGYESFVMSVCQVGIENYMIINETQSRVDYFPDMFEVSFVDVGYGSVIAFNGGKVDDSFWDKADHLTSRIAVGYIDRMLDNPAPTDYYPATRHSTLNEVKANVAALLQNGDNWHISNVICDYVTAEDVFVSDEAIALKDYVAPSDNDVFMQEISLREDRVIAIYTRMINGFETEEKICINGYTGEIGNVSKSGVEYTEEDLLRVPDIGEAMAGIDLAKIHPPHIKVEEGMTFSHAIASGVYRKGVPDSNQEEQGIYGIIRIIWFYEFSDIENAYQRDDMYYIYHSDGVGYVIEREGLEKYIGDDPFILSFPYDSAVAWN